MAQGARHAGEPLQALAGREQGRAAQHSAAQMGAQGHTACTQRSAFGPACLVADLAPQRERLQHVVVLR